MAYEKPTNLVFTTAEIIEYLIDSNILGYSKFNSIEDLRKDMDYKNIKEKIGSVAGTDEVLDITLEA